MSELRWQARGRGGAPYKRGGRGGWAPRSFAAPPKKPSAPAPPLGNLIQDLKPEDLEDASRDLEGVANITKRSLVTSFNWLDADNSTILIPGRPPKWSPLSQAREIPDDNGKYGIGSSISTRKEFRDQNAARFPRHPMEPAVLAALTMTPNLCSEQIIDVVACGSTMGNLLRFGYGHSFPEHYTIWEHDVAGSKSHQRIVRYRFGSMNFMMRFEGDGFIAKTAALENSNSSSTKVNSREKTLLDELTDSLSETTLSKGLNPPCTNLKVKRSGDLVNQDLIFDLKTRSCKKIDQIEDIIKGEIPRLWLAGISKLIFAFHGGGVFRDVLIEELSDKIKEWEAANKVPLAKMAALIHRIGDIVRGRSDGKLELCHSQAGVLEIREQLPDAGDALSPAVREMWLESTLQSDDDDASSGESGSGDESSGVRIDWDEKEQMDYTACSTETCGYCGRCSY
ncbi:hypothetical protein MCOR03_006536 [Pyricularia oryzae]|nr:hypothetical protein MCOR03_006536 [Pyricularia oryzae]